MRSEASHLKRENVKPTLYGIPSVRYLGPKVRSTVPQNIRECNSLDEFESLRNLILGLVEFAKTTLLKCVLFDAICIESICLSFLNIFLIVGVN